MESRKEEMMEAIKREIHGYMHNGERVYLGPCNMTDTEVQEFLDNMAEIYSDPKAPGVFNVRSAVFDARAFAGVQIRPPSNA
jgi:hypothetical protein